MQRVRVHNFSISADGFAAGPGQDLEHPIGHGGEALHKWIFDTAEGRAMIGQSGGDEGVDNDFIRARTENVGATVMGRNMFGPVRGEWGIDSWVGWWGNNPPFHHPVFVLTHYARDPIEMDGGTTFHFVVDGPQRAIERAIETAEGRDVVVGGGASTLRACLGAGLIDDLHLAEVPVLLGQGERLFSDAGEIARRYRCTERVCSSAVTHLKFERATR